MFENNIGEARRNYALSTESGRFTQEDAARAIGVATGTSSPTCSTMRGATGRLLFRLASRR